MEKITKLQDLKKDSKVFCIQFYDSEIYNMDYVKINFYTDDRFKEWYKFSAEHELKPMGAYSSVQKIKLKKHYFLSEFTSCMYFFTLKPDNWRIDLKKELDIHIKNKKKLFNNELIIFKNKIDNLIKKRITMKKITLATTFIFIITILSCTNKIEKPKQPIEFNIKHELRKFNVKTSTTEQSSGWYFLVMGGYTSNKYEETKVRFYFKNCEGVYQFQELPLRKIRIKLDSTVVVPYICFDLDNENGKCYNLQVDWQVTSATIYCTEKDFQPEININTLG